MNRCILIPWLWVSPHKRVTFSTPFTSMPGVEARQRGS